MLDIINVNVLSNGSCVPGSYVRVEGESIAEVGSMAERNPANAEVLDGEGSFLCPGFIDLHNHGAMGADVMDAAKEAFDAIARFHFEHGTAGFLFSTMSATREDVEAVFSALENYSSPVPNVYLGVHLEGPYLSPGNRGAHPANTLKTPDAESYKFIERFGPSIRLLTIAPNLDGAAEFTRFCSDRGIVVFSGHDNAVESEISDCVERGMRGVTHLYCCSSTISRRPGSYVKHTGIVERCLNDNNLYAELTADGHAIPEDLFRLVYRNKGYGRILLASDSMRATGLGPGHYVLGGGEDAVEVEVLTDVAVLTDYSAFAGSVATMETIVARLIGEYGLPPEHVSHMASGVQAELLGLTNLGAVAPGYSARLNLLNRQGKLLGVIAGETVYKKDDV